MTAAALRTLFGRIGAPFQQAWIVEDLAAAEDAMGRTLGCGEFVDLKMDQEWILRGRTARCTLALGFARTGNVQIELMQPLGGEGVHVEYFERFGPGPHHLGFLVDDRDAAVEDAAVDGFPVVMSTEFSGIRLCYLDTFDELGLYVELIEDPHGALMAFMPWRESVMVAEPAV